MTLEAASFLALCQRDAGIPSSCDRATETWAKDTGHSLRTDVIYMLADSTY